MKEPCWNMRRCQRFGMLTLFVIFVFLIFRLHNNPEEIVIDDLRSSTPDTSLISTLDTSPISTLDTSPISTLDAPPISKLVDVPEHLLKQQCPVYSYYSSVPHLPYSNGPLKLAFQRPVKECRTFQSAAVEKVIEEVTSRMKDPDLARIFENCFPNTLDTTIRWYTLGETPKAFITTGDINAEWIRDSANQLQPYIDLLPYDEELKKLVSGAIRIQAQFISSWPYCNAFNAPPESNIPPVTSTVKDRVFPAPDRNIVFECKYELDSLASFLDLSNEYYAATKDTGFMDEDWIKAIESIFNVIKDQQMPTFNNDNSPNLPGYLFERMTTLATETLSLNGIGNPVNAGTLLIKSSFRPSDDATILPFLIPANAMMAVQLEKISILLNKIGKEDLGTFARTTSNSVRKGIEQHAIFEHAVFGKMFAYEVDGYGGRIIMDDANIPSLLSLPRLGFLEKDDQIYLNTRKAILSKTGNPYYLEGSVLKGIGGPHIGLRNAWPMSLLQQISTTDDDDEIIQLLELLKQTTFGLGLIHESVNVNNGAFYTRSWFSWANSEFARMILELAKRKPLLIFKDQRKPFDLKSLF